MSDKDLQKYWIAGPKVTKTHGYCVFVWDDEEKETKLVGRVGTFKTAKLFIKEHERQQVIAAQTQK